MQRPRALMEKLLQDIRFGFRQLIKQPGFAALAIISMALGIGANTSIFSLVDTALLRPLAVKEPSQLVELYGTLHNGADWSLQSYPNYKDYRDRNTVFSGLFVYRVVVSSLTVNNSSQRVWGYLVSGNYFDVLGVKPMLGRAFLPEEDQTPDSHPVAVISHSCWQHRFGGDPSDRRQDGRVQQPAVHYHRRRAERIYWHRSRLRSGNVHSGNDGEDDRAREHLDRQARLEQPLHRRPAETRRVIRASEGCARDVDRATGARIIRRTSAAAFGSGNRACSFPTSRILSSPSPECSRPWVRS